MVEFDINLNNVKLRIVCNEEYKNLIIDLMNGHSKITNSNGMPTYTLIIKDYINKVENANYFLMTDKWFDNAKCDVWIDNYNKTAYMSNIQVSKEKWKNLLIQYFACNLFNRLLEENGYISFHASCADKNNIGITFIGERNSGKTNCLLNLMNFGFNSVSNDKLAIQYDGIKLNGYGVAQDISIRMDKSFTIQDQNKKYIEYAKKTGFVFNDCNLLDGNSIHINSIELAKLNNVKQIATTEIKYIIFPKYNSEIKDISLIEVNKKKSIELMKDQLIPLVHDTTSFFSEIKSIQSKKIEVENIINRMADLSCFKLSQGENSIKSFIKSINKLLE